VVNLLQCSGKRFAEHGCYQPCSSKQGDASELPQRHEKQLLRDAGKDWTGQGLPGLTAGDAAAKQAAEMEEGRGLPAKICLIF